jgi:hypothetical protein
VNAIGKPKIRTLSCIINKVLEVEKKLKTCGLKLRSAKKSKTDKKKRIKVLKGN